MERRRERRERERQQRKAQNRTQSEQGAGLLSRRNFLRNSAIGAVGLAGAAIIARTQFFDEEQNPSNLSSSEKQNPQILEVSESDFRLQASKAIDDYKRIFQSNIDKQFLLNNIVYIPNLATLPKAARDELCSYVICTDAAGYTGGKNPDGSEDKIYVFKDKIELRHAQTVRENPVAVKNNPQIIREYINIYIRQVVLHEMVHFMGKERYPVSRELDEMFRKYAGQIQPDLQNQEEYKPSHVEGFSVEYRKPDKGGAAIFRGIEEAIAINTELYVSKPTALEPRLVHEDPTYFFQQYRLLNDLFTKISPGTLKTVLELRSKPGSLDELIKIIGQKYESEPSKQFEKGFQILWAIELAKDDQYRQLTSNR